MAWNPLRIPLNKGLAQNVAGRAFDGKAPRMLRGLNLDYGTEGAVRGRSGWEPLETYMARTLDSSGGGVYSSYLSLASASQASSTTTNTHALPIEIKDRYGSRPGLLAANRLFVQDGSPNPLLGTGARWIDRGGCVPTRVTKVGSFSSVDLGTMQNWNVQALNASYTFGHRAPVNTNNGPLVFLDDFGREATTLAAPGTGKATRGLSARCGDYSAMLYQSGAQLLMYIHQKSTDTCVSSNLGGVVNCRVGSGSLSTVFDNGNNSCVCCDWDQTGFFVVYLIDNGAGAPHQYRVLKVSTAGAVTASATFTAGGNVDVSTGVATTQASVWICNTPVSRNTLVVADQTSSGVHTKIIDATTLADMGIDATLTANVPTTWGPNVVCGAADSVVWVAFTSQDGFDPVIGGGASFATDSLRIYQRSTLANTQWLLSTRKFRRSLMNTSDTGTCILIQHQPVIVGTSVLLGLSTIKTTSATIPATLNNPVATWSVHDLNYLWQDGSAGSIGTLAYANRDPVCVAKGERDGSAPPWAPNSAMVSADGRSYRFSSLDWNDVQAKVFGTVQVYYEGAGNAVCTLNNVELLEPQVAHIRGNTVIAGNVPRMLSTGFVTPVGFPWSEAPGISIIVGGGGTLVAGSYAITAIWQFVDEAGNVTRSSVSHSATATIAAPGGRIDVYVQHPHFNEREYGAVSCRVYSTVVNGTGNAPTYFRGSTEYRRDAAECLITLNVAPDGSEELLYTVGGVLESQVPRADGGVTVSANRCWVSDGSSLFASRLGDEQANNEAPSWHIDDSLLVHVPTLSSLIVGLASNQDQVFAVTGAGVWATTGEGPDDLGHGSSFRDPVQIAQVGGTAQRSMASVPGGVVLQANYTLQDGRPETGGLWFVTVNQESYISGPIRDEISSNEAGDLVYHPVRNLLLWVRPTAGKIIVYDQRAQAWTTWEANERHIGSDEGGGGS